MAVSPTKGEDYAISDVENCGLKVCMSFPSLLPSRSLLKIIKKFSGNSIA